MNKPRHTDRIAVGPALDPSERKRLQTQNDNESRHRQHEPLAITPDISRIFILVTKGKEVVDEESGRYDSRDDDADDSAPKTFGELVTFGVPVNDPIDTDVDQCDREFCEPAEKR